MLLIFLLMICAPICEPTVLSLVAKPSQPIEGTSMTLNCTVQSRSQKSAVQLQYSFYKDEHVLLSEWSSSPLLQIAAMWRTDTGLYLCKAKTAESTSSTRSQRVWINVRRIPVCNVSLETHPPRGHIVEGEKLVFTCVAAAGTGDITFFWYKGTLGLNVETKTQRSLTAKFEIPAVQESDAQQYYCAADNGYGPSLSGLVSIAVRIPVSRPVLTLWAPTQAVVGDVMELHCEAQRGSPPIMYRFYCEDIVIASSPAPSGGGVSFNLSLTAQHSGNYACEADNGVGAQRSQVKALNITVPIGDKRGLLPSGVIEGLVGIIGLITVALLFCCWFKRKRERHPVIHPRRRPPNSVHQELTYLNSPAPLQRELVYGNVNVVSGHEVYSLVYHTQQECPSIAVEPQRTHKDSDIYSWLKKPSITDMDYEEAM